METESKLKEVYFGTFCPLCTFINKNDDEEPCEECLRHPGNWDSHRPVKFVKRSKRG